MKSLSEYILERGNEDKEEKKNDVTSEEKVWAVKDKDLDAILDVCTTEEDAKKAFDSHMEENEDNHLEIVSMNRSEVEKND